MAEFQEVMRQWRRMCEKNQADCMRFCPICANPACGELTEATDEDIRKAEDAIMAWAKEHPEPVYPTWYKWLESMGIVSKMKSEYSEIFDTICAGPRMFEPIPADIAEKLWIKPKEG